MPHRARVLVVDDSSLVRRTLQSVIDSDDQLRVVGSAPNGAIALRMVKSKNPDVMILDVEMPDMSGIEVLQVMTREHAHVPVVMFSAHTDRGAGITMDALLAGAADYVAKPSRTNGYEDTCSRIRMELLPKLHGLLAKRLSTVAPRPGGILSQAFPTPARTRARDGAIELVAIGCSTGGPEALAAVLSSLGEPLPAPIIITQHMPPIFTKALADRLAQRTGQRVREAEGGEVLHAGDVYVAPGDRHLTVRKVKGRLAIALDDGPRENSCRPAVDVMLRSVADVVASESLIVILTGMGNDGLRGCRAAKERGARIIAQDKASSVVWGMPGHVARAGLADKTLPVDQIGAAIRVHGTRRIARATSTLAGERSCM